MSVAHTTAPISAQAPTSSLVRWGDWIARTALIILFALVPFLVLPVSWAAIPQSKMLLSGALLIIALFAWVIARFAEGTVHIPRSWLLFSVLLLPVAYIVSSIGTGWETTGLVGEGIEQDTLVAVVIWYVLFAVASCIFFADRSALRASVPALFVGIIILAVVEIAYIIFPSMVALGGALNGTTANPFGSWHDLGIVMGLALFMSVALFNSTLFSGFWRVVPVLLGILATTLLLIIHFADVFWGIAILFAVAAVGVVRAGMRADGLGMFSVARRALPWVLFALCAGALGFVNTQIVDVLPERLQRTEVEVRPSWQGTLDVAKNSLDAPSSLLFGAGPNSFIREWGIHKPQSVNLTPFWNSDFNYGVGIIPTSIFAVGFLGVVAWGAILLALAGLLFRFAVETRPLTSGRVLFGTLLLAVGYLITFHMIYTPGVALTGMTFMFMAMLVVAAAGDAAPRSLTVGLSGNSLIGLFGLIFFAASGSAAVIAAEREVVSNLFVNKGSAIYRETGDVARASATLGQALTIAPKNDRAHRAAAELGIIELSLLLQNSSEDEAVRAKLEETIQATIQHALTAVEIDGRNYQNWLSLAQLYSNLAGANVAGAFDSAKEAYQEAFEAQPTNPVPKLRLAQLAIAQNDLSSARTYLQETIALKQDFAAAYFLLSQVEASAGQGDPAVAAAAQAVQLVPEDPLGWFNLGYILYSGASYENAAAALERAATITQDYANALFVLGLTYDALGRDSEAIAVFTRVAELNPQETWLKQVIANIQAGKEPFFGISR